MGASNELSKEYRGSAADGSRHRRGSSRVLLCSATGFGVLEFRRVWPALAVALNNADAGAKHSARFFNSTFVVAFQAANTAGEKRCARKRQRHRRGKR